MKDKNIKKICIIAQGYPTEKQPCFPFVDQLLCAFSDQDVECTVIAPQSVLKGIKNKNFRRPQYWEREYNGKIIKVFQPLMLSFSNIKIRGIYLSSLCFEKAAMRCFKKLNKKFDCIYGHFWECGLIASKIGYRYNIPAFVASGESVIKKDLLIRNWKFKDFISGVVAVSTKNKNESIELGLCSEDNVLVCPNAIDEKLFYPRNRITCRQSLDISENDFVVAFVGAFSERKGSFRVSQALDEIEGVKSIFIGSGPIPPNCKDRVFTGQLPHNLIPDYLSAADVFVLPTLHEGCCNAIIEAMACGLPIISSNLDFNDDILNEYNSIRVDPNSIEEIKNAIVCLRNDNEKLSAMSEAALKTANDLKISKRAEKILGYISEKIH